MLVADACPGFIKTAGMANGEIRQEGSEQSRKSIA